MKGRNWSAFKHGGCTIGISLVVQILIVAMFVPADDPMYGAPSCQISEKRLKQDNSIKLYVKINYKHTLFDRFQQIQIIKGLQ